MQKSGRERGTNDPKAADRKKHAVPKEPRQADPASVRQGRPSADKGDLTVQRESVAPVKHRGGDENIVRVKTDVDRPMLVLILLLLSLGSIMVFSASYPSALAQEGDSLFYIKKQLLFVAIGLTFMIGLSYLPPKFYKTFTVALFAFAVFLLVIVLIPGIGISNGEARRWLGLKGTSFTFQPSEIMKVALVMILAWYTHPLFIRRYCLRPGYAGKASVRYDHYGGDRAVRHVYRRRPFWMDDVAGCRRRISWRRLVPAHESVRNGANNYLPG